MQKQQVIGVVGLGYVGLPLAVEFGKKVRTLGFDLSKEKVDAYRRHVDATGEVSTEDLRAAALLEPTVEPERLAEADFIIVAVPTPLDAAHQPDFSPLVRRQHHGRPPHEEGRHGRLRVDRLPGCDGRGLHPAARA